MKRIFSKVLEIILEVQARRLLNAHDPTIVAVTGSLGKTSTKQAITHVLGDTFKVLTSKSSYNTAVGLPLSMFAQTTPSRLTSVVAWIKILYQNEQKIHGNWPYDVLVLEMGADHPGDISNFMRYIKPDVGVITGVKSVHLEGFEDIEEVLEEKWQLALGSEVVVINADDPKLSDRSRSLDQSVHTYGVLEGGVHVQDISLDSESLTMSGKLVIKGKSEDVTFPVFATHSLYALVASVAVGNIFDIPTTKIAKMIQSFQGPRGRMNVLNGKHGSRIIDDSYNSSPSAAIAALKTLKSLPGKKVAILGSMNELGKYAEAGHQKVGRKCGDLDLLVTIGELAQDHLVPAAVKAGLNSDQVKSYKSPYKAGRYVVSELTGNETVLVKGSQNGVFSEEAVAFLLADPADRTKLVRQGAQWQQIKRAEFPDDFSDQLA